ncbi:hypothetical protein [Halegenticoccus tardaugens]|uniref:hypothetical protein n=1 Tax=Halegenticoccus tardaugens TaxID=2071624 RepID=UPI00100C2042|nr:hypothetical protein [Halegenticoccus tardaugens]
MSDLNEHVIDEAAGRGDAFVLENLLALVERHERDPEPGVPVDRLRAYAAAIDAAGGPMSEEQVEGTLDSRLVDAGTWSGGDRLYRLGDDRVGLYPASWYDRLADETYLSRYVEVILEDVDDSENAFETGGAGAGVPEDVLLTAATVIGDKDRGEAAAELEALGDEGYVVADAEQHPNARIRLTEKYFDERG